MGEVSGRAATAAAPIPIVALDVPFTGDALRLVDRLGDSCDFYKIGGELFTAAGPSVVDAVASRGARVFLDLKFHDIPNTVRASAKSAAGLGATLITVHSSGGRSMIEAAVEGAGDRCGVMAVTVLTSLDAPALGEAWGRPELDVAEEVMRLADLARSAGAFGIVCSGEEAGLIHARHGAALKLLVPGIRLAGGAAHDQVRVVTPAAAAAAGAAYIVLGRAVTAASDPAAAMATVRAALGPS